MNRLLKTLILVLFLSNVFHLLVWAQTSTPQSVSDTTINEVAIADGTPYRGMLPNNPLYKLQIFWDRIRLRFTPNALKKAEKYLSFATRELEAAEEMLSKGDESLALHTALRGEHYITQLVDNTKSAAYYEGGVNPKIFERSHAVYPAHQALLDRMIAKVSTEAQNTLKSVKEFSTRNDMELYKLEAEMMEATPPGTRK